MERRPSSPKSEASYIAVTTPSPYRRRFHRETRREAWEKLLKKSPRQKGQSTSPTSPNDDYRGKSTDELDETDKDSSREYDDDEQLLIKEMEAVSFKVRSSVESEDGKKSFVSGNTSATAASSSIGYAFLHEDGDALGNHMHTEDGETDNMNLTKRLPQHLAPHLEEQASKPHFYRVLYRGVVALVSRPDSRSQRSGAYVSYGEIISSNYELDLDEIESVATIIPETRQSFSRSPNTSETNSFMYPDSPPRSVLSHNAGSVSSLDTLKTASSAGLAKLLFPPKQHAVVLKRAIRVDNVLTGGYAIDASESATVDDLAPKTPKRSNAQYLPLICPSPLPLGTNLDTFANGDVLANQEVNLGFLFTEKKGVALVEELLEVPQMEHGKFIYQIVASTPIPVLTGPCADAPKTRVMLLPGTTHEVCLRIFSDDIVYLRLSHRRGWIADRKISFLGGNLRIGAIPAVKEITPDTKGETDDSTISALSIASSSVSTPGSVARRRHRPPRRKLEAASDATEMPLMPRQIQSKNAFMSPSKNQRLTHSTPRKPLTPPPMPDKDMTPSSNVSVLSDDNISAVMVDQLTPDRSIAATQKNTRETNPTYYLMRVNAPRGLRILDAPQFQVNNLIHGQLQPSKQLSSNLDVRSEIGSTVSARSNSIFQTMGQGTYTTKKSTKQVGNPAIFDSVKRARILPRGAMFEASQRMESSGSFSESAGLIKLSDDSGWAIVPTQSELDFQYRNYHGGVASVREGEATRAFEEVGNAILNAEEGGRVDHPSTIWLRVTARNGSIVECPPLMSNLSNVNEVSPTSSAGTSSISGAGSNYGLFSGQDSDVASSVGSAFLDAIFKTPSKKKASDSSTGEKGRNAMDKKQYGLKDSNGTGNCVIACGMCVEVENFEENLVITEKSVIVQDYVRLRGGQGWIALCIGGKPVAEIIPKPVFRVGSFWFRVVSPRGIRVRLGPSRRANAIKSEDDVYFRFECGEFLRASEIITIFNMKTHGESFAKLYRNRHILVHQDPVEARPLSHMTLLAEWVQIYGDGTLSLEECAAQPRIERHRDGWRYNVVKETGVAVRKGPSFASETVGPVLLPGKSVLINERVTPPGERICWLRLKDGMGWVHDMGKNEETVLIAHSLRHRTDHLARSRPSGLERNDRDDVAYNTIVARLFPQQEHLLRTSSTAYQTTQNRL